MEQPESRNGSTRILTRPAIRDCSDKGRLNTSIIYQQLELPDARNGRLGNLDVLKRGHSVPDERFVNGLFVTGHFVPGRFGVPQCRLYGVYRPFLQCTNHAYS